MGHYDNCRDGCCPRCGQSDSVKHDCSKITLTKRKDVDFLSNNEVFGDCIPTCLNCLGGSKKTGCCCNDPKMSACYYDIEQERKQKEEKKINQKLMAFWKYHNGFYDTLLCDVIKDINNEGKVYVPSYQSWVKPVLILPLKAGKLMSDKINEIEEEFDNKRIDLVEEYKNKIAELLK